MASKRGKIKMTDSEIAEFLDAPRAISVATNGRDGWPHIMPLWFVMRDGEPWAWTYGKSQKVRNIERNPKATLVAEDGSAYNELRGVMLKSTAQIHDDLKTVLGVGEEVLMKYMSPDGGVSDAMREGLKAQAAKRIALQFKVESTTSWDHRKL